MLANLWSDVCYSLRVLRKSPTFATVALVSVILGVGANVLVFSVLNAVLLRPLNVTDSQSLYQIRHKQWMMGRLLTSSYPAFEDFRQRSTSFSGLAAINGYSHAELRWRNLVKNIAGNEVSGNYFALLGIQPSLGRFFNATDEHGPGSAPFVVLSNSLWQTLFQADPEVIGRVVELNQHPFTVVGITPADFQGTERFERPDYWVPMVNEEQIQGQSYLVNRGLVAVTVIGRLKAGVTAQQATHDLNRIATALAKEHPASDDGQPLPDSSGIAGR
jgi:hypothetical protein